MAGKKKEIKSRLSSAGMAGLAILGFGGCGKSSNPAANSASSLAPRQPLVFVGDVRQGPSAGLSVFGILELQLASSGQVSGAVVHHGERVPVSGVVEGRSLTLVLQLPNGGKITGVGIADHEIRSIDDAPKSGTLTGPNPGDKGDWEEEEIKFELKIQ